MQASEQRAAKQPEASPSVSNAALQALQTDLQHQVRTQPVPDTEGAPSVISDGNSLLGLHQCNDALTASR